ncbi:MAG: hypothetical protein V8R80_07960 [Eubacterium sp.]
MAGGGNFPLWPRRGLGAKLAFWLLGENFLYGHGVGWAQNLLFGWWGKFSFVSPLRFGHKMLLPCNIAKQRRIFFFIIFSHREPVCPVPLLPECKCTR